MAKSIMQTDKRCYLTGSCEDLHKHHIFQGCRRKASERWGCWIYLREDLHNLSERGVHSDKELDDMLKEACQRRFEDLYDHDTFMAVFGKNYIHSEEETIPQGGFLLLDETLPFG